MSSPKASSALKRLGHDLRIARLQRKISVADLSVRAGSSASTIGRLEKGDPGVAIGTLAGVLVALGLSNRLADLLDIRHDEIGLALAVHRVSKRGRSHSAVAKRKVSKSASGAEPALPDIDPDGLAF